MLDPTTIAFLVALLLTWDSTERQTPVWLQATAVSSRSAVTSGFVVKFLLHFQLHFPCFPVSLAGLPPKA